MNDPNGFCYWRGSYHLFYQLRALGSDAMEWGHAYSRDLVHWKDLPIAIHKDVGAIYSGQVLVEEDRVIAIYHNTKKGNCIATASDPLLLDFKKHPGNPVIAPGKVDGEGFQRPFDPCIWKGRDGLYYSVSGVCKNGSRNADGFPVADLFRSQDLARWEYIGLLIQDEDWKSVGVGPGDDSAVPNFHPIGRGKHMFLWFSHGKGGHAMVGTYDEPSHHFIPECYYRMNYGPVYKGTLHAPSATVDPQGRLLAIFNVRENRQDVREALSTSSNRVWYGIMTLACRYWLAEDDTLQMAPAGDIEALRHGHRRLSAAPMAAGTERVLEKTLGNAIELRAVIDPGAAEEVGLKVLRSPDGTEYTKIAYNPGSYTLTLDVSQGSNRDDVPDRAPEIGPLQLADGEKLDLRIFVDRSIVEVFANDRQCLTARVYPAGKDSTSVSLFAAGGDAKLVSLDCWQMRSIWPELVSGPTEPE